ncbi:uncharacterized protein BDZ99DRAFT_516200 [Mytilinidion resinicola]|uniref:Uncharacterized protein n=1 Tax=Mytilinidion resinicola TaxID=574789 RepID=A0A6A6Z2T9_9PEZI|nr:uncharacterized protein BDZ99DRAFT_516200 [Mytilinidion resinicola]KAF2815482.1 hypothetical protein BDZ99DRAFT_516200 [Mytilinidion resinicola]
MATGNGILTPPSLDSSASATSATKRKRSTSTATNHSAVASAEHAGSSLDGLEKGLQETLEDVFAVLKSYDTQPSILNLPLKATSDRSSSGEPSVKRTKLTPSDSPTSITSRLRDGTYNSLADLASDVELAASDIISTITPAEPATNGAVQRHAPSPEETRLYAGVLAFQKVLRNIVTRENQRRTLALKDSKTPTENGAPVGKDAVSLEDIHDSRTVLTLYGTAQGPKQLFSSLQQPLRVQSADSPAPYKALDTSVEVTMPLAEAGLPNIISTTKIFPVDVVEQLNSKKTGPTFGELFAPPPHVPQLSPPKTAKQLTTRGNTIRFVSQDQLPKVNRKIPMYSTQPLSTGQSLGYSGVEPPKEPTSPNAKAKSRQRALSTGEAQQPPSESIVAAAERAKDDALFRSAYSSFAPCRDDAAAIIPEETRNRIWWQKVGEKRFEETFAIDPSLIDPSLLASTGAAESASVGADEDETFKDAVENFIPDETDFLAEAHAKAQLDKDTDEILAEISELLETLASHQQIRNSSLATRPQTPVIPNSSLASLVGSPTSPGSDEIDVYNILKSQLTLMISSLPPYAVAKLNGDRLSELSISRDILIESKDYRGVMEEDQVSRVAKATALSAAAGPPPIVRMGSGSMGTHSHYAPTSTQYVRPPPPQSPAPRSAHGPQSYYPQQQAPHRSPSVHYPRSSNAPVQSYQTPGAYASSTPRPSYPATQAYGQQTPRPAYQANGSSQYYQQRSAQPSNYGMGGSQYYQPPQPQPQTRYPPQAQNSYQQRPPAVAPMYNNYGSSQSPHIRTASPLKAGQQPARPAPTPYNGSRSGYGTPTSNGQMGGPSYFSQPASQPPAQYSTPQPATPANLGPSGFHSTMTAEQQQLMMDRNRAQLAAQPAARVAAQEVVNRQGSGTPQPANGQYPGQQQQVNGIPMAT